MGSGQAVPQLGNAVPTFECGLFGDMPELISTRLWGARRADLLNTPAALGEPDLRPWPAVTWVRVSATRGWVQDWRNSVTARGLLARPFVTAAFAVSADGCLAEHKGQPTAISCPDSQCVTHLLRSMHEAVLVGLGTVLSDDPLLTTRLVEGPTGHRVVLDSELRTPLTARLLSTKERPVVLFGRHSADPSRADALRDKGAEVERLRACARGVDLHAVLGRLKARGVTTLMVEGGAQVLESFFSEGLVDYVSLTRAPSLADGPDSVRLGPVVEHTLGRWSASATLASGVDRVTFGRLF